MFYVLKSDWLKQVEVSMEKRKTLKKYCFISVKGVYKAKKVPGMPRIKRRTNKGLSEMAPKNRKKKAHGK